jgi:hypothetical protein
VQARNERKGKERIWRKNRSKKEKEMRKVEEK